MDNPFGLPNEVMTAIVTAALNQQTQATKSSKPKNPFNVDAPAMAKKSASTAKNLYDAYVEAGFTAGQAFELVKGILTARKN